MKVVYADNKRVSVACSNFLEAKFYTGEVGPVEVVMRPEKGKQKDKLQEED